MKIAIDARFYGTENGGLGRYSMNLLSEIQKQDTQNTYFLLLREKYYKGLSLPKNFQKVLVQSRHYSLSEQFELLRVLKKINPDLTHFLHFNVPLFYNRQYIVTIHDLLMHDGIGKEATTLPMWKYYIKRLGYRTVFDHAVKSAKHIITPSKFVKQQVIKTYNVPVKNVSVIYEGVSLSDNKKTVLPSRYFLYVGNAYPHKNIKTLLKAIGLINQQSRVLVKLILVAPRDVFTERLKAEIKNLNVSKFVEIKSGVEDLELINLYSHAVSFVYPSLLEGFGLPGLEAMKCKTRLIASDIDVFHEIYGSHAEYFDPYSTEELAICLQKILTESKSERQSKLIAADKFSQRYSWGSMAHDTLAVYESA